MTSTLDWFGEKFMDYLFPPYGQRCGRLNAVFKDHAIPAGSCQITDPHIQTIYERPLVLVRPDGHAWPGVDKPCPMTPTVSSVKSAGTSRSAKSSDLFL